MWAKPTFSDSFAGWLFLWPQIAFPHACANQDSTVCSEGTSADLPASIFMTSPAWHSALDLHVEGNLYLSSNQETTGLCLGSSPCAVPGNFLRAVSEGNQSTCATVSQLSEIAVLFLMTNVLNTIVSHVLSVWVLLLLLFFYYFKQEDISGPCHFILTRSWNSGKVDFLIHKEYFCCFLIY